MSTIMVYCFVLIRMPLKVIDVNQTTKRYAMFKELI